MINLNQPLEAIIAWVNGWRLDKFIKKLFDKSASLWDKISVEVQEIIKAASGIVEVIRKMAGSTPQFILDKISEIFPFFNSEALSAILTKVTQMLNLVSGTVSLSLVDMIKKVSDYLLSVLPEGVEAAAHTVASLIATFATPEATTFGVITAIMKYVFETFVKGKFKIA